MPKTVAITLHRLTCESADDLPGGLNLSGKFLVHTYDVESSIKQTEVLFNGSVRLRKGESKEINEEARVNLNAPTQDRPHKLAPDFVKFGGEVTQVGGMMPRKQPDDYYSRIHALNGGRGLDKGTVRRGMEPLQEELVEVSQLLGHSELRVTADLYAHLQQQTAATAARRMDAILNG